MRSGKNHPVYPGKGRVTQNVGRAKLIVGSGESVYDKVPAFLPCNHDARGVGFVIPFGKHACHGCARDKLPRAGPLLRPDARLPVEGA